MQHPDIEPRREGRLWIFPDGTTLPVVAGGDGSTDAEDEALADLDEDEIAELEALTDDERTALAELVEQPPVDKPLGPAGEKALGAEKERRRKLAGQLREWRALGITPAEAKKRLAASGKGKADPDDDAPDIDQIKAEAKAEAATEALRDRLLDKIEAKAARLFADPDDAAALLMRGRDVDDFLDDDGKIDAEAIVDALDELIERKPYLAAGGKVDPDDGAADGKGKPKPKAPGGPRGGKPKALEDHSVDDFRKLLKRDK